MTRDISKPDNFEESSSELLLFSKNVLELEANTITQASEKLGNNFLTAVHAITNCTALNGKIILTGIGKSGHIAKKIAATLSSTGTPSFFVHPAEAGHGDLGMIDKNDLVIAISQSGSSDEIIKMIPYFQRNRITLIAMTGDQKSPLAEFSEITIDTSVDKEACPLNLAPTASTTLTLALGDALAMTVMKCKGINSEAFALTHPHGKLGRKLLTTVASVMVTGDNIPRDCSEAVVLDAIIEISRCGLGFTLVLNIDRKVIGMFTDGDLRRLVNKNNDIKSTKIIEHVNPNFIHIESGELAVKAVELMDTHKVSSMPVFENTELVGAINTRILLQAGVV